MYNYKFSVQLHFCAERNLELVILTVEHEVSLSGIWTEH